MPSFTVRRGRRYRATIALDFFEQFADNETIAARLREVGFEDVEVWGDGGRRIAEASWLGEDASAPLPPQVSSVVEVS